MHAWWYERAGDAADVLEFGELDDVIPGPGEVRVRVHYSAINPTDTKRRREGREIGRFERIIPNNDGSGVIDRIGEGVDRARLGEAVWMYGAQAGRPFGTAATHCVLPSTFARRLPGSSDAQLQGGACLGVPAVTAHRGLFAEGRIDGKTVLITGGTGRVGRYAVQMACASGATVIASAGTRQKVDALLALGAHHAFDYNNTDQVQFVSDATAGQGVDLMLDVEFGYNVHLAPQLVRANGTVTTYSSQSKPVPEIPFYPLMFNNITLRPFSIMGMPDAAKLAAFEAIELWLTQACLSHQIDTVFDFAEMPAAHLHIENAAGTGVCLVRVTHGP